MSLTSELNNKKNSNYNSFIKCLNSFNILAINFMIFLRNFYCIARVLINARATSLKFLIINTCCTSLLCFESKCLFCE